MQRRIPIFIICSPRPRVGKTLLSRVLIDFLRSDDRPVSAFDVNPDDFPLMDYLPGHTAVANVAETRDQIALFDRLLAPGQDTKVVDLGHYQFETFFTVVEQINFVEEARRRGLVPVALYLADGHRRSQQGFARILRRHPNLALAPVINEALPLMLQLHGDLPRSRLAGPPLVIPALSPMIRGITERASFSFAAVATTGDKSSELYTWTRRMFAAFRELELRLLLADITPVLKISA
jgi:hypothetical protein